MKGRYEMLHGVSDFFEFLAEDCRELHSSVKIIRADISRYLACVGEMKNAGKIFVGKPQAT
jgi:hypothetical protein